jgi:cytochrome c peroxidase
MPPNSFTKAKPADAQFAEVLKIVGNKCVDCHSKETHFPFYAKLPIAKQLMAYDILMGNRHVNYAQELFPAGDKPVSEPVLAKTERIVADNAMPPFRYIALHWKAGLTTAERETILNWVRTVRAKNYMTAGVAPQFAKDAVQPLPDKIDVDPQKAALGNNLFHDKRLSKNNSLACAGCHGLDKGGTDQERFSSGVGGQKGGINAPTVFNSAYQFMLFWDGRAATLEEQADGPVNNPVEMASNWAEAIPKLQQDAELTTAFNAVYPQGYSKETITEAIAMFERTLLTPSRFDKYLRGDANALTQEEQKGYRLFAEHRCNTCHAGKILGGQSFEYMGLYGDYFKDRGKPDTPDFGRFSKTKQEDDRFKLKVPTLRNIALTFPYFHDSTTSDLQQAVKTMAKYQTPKPLSDADAALIVTFLKSLTGEYNGKPL